MHGSELSEHVLYDMQPCNQNLSLGDLLISVFIVFFHAQFVHSVLQSHSWLHFLFLTSYLFVCMCSTSVHPCDCSENAERFDRKIRKNKQMQPQLWNLTEIETFSFAYNALDVCRGMHKRSMLVRWFLCLFSRKNRLPE